MNSCSETEEKKESTDATSPRLEEIDNKEVADKIAPKKPDLIISDSISILLPTSYSSEDFSVFQSNLESRNWVGLFRNDNKSVTCSKTKLKIEPIHNQMFDEDGEMSGRMISCEGHDNDPMLFIEGIEISKDLQIESYKGLKSRLDIGESMQFGDITIKALGTRDEESYNIKVYKLVIIGEKNGTNIEQTFLEQEGFDDAMIEFIWAGDIDKDGFPDLYMDISYKYSFSNPALFLSSKAGDNELLKFMAAIRIYAC